MTDHTPDTGNMDPADMDRLEDTVAALLAALEPFAALGKKLSNTLSDNELVLEGPHGDEQLLTVGDFRRAAAAVAKARGEAK